MSRGSDSRVGDGRRGGHGHQLLPRSACLWSSALSSWPSARELGGRRNHHLLYSAERARRGPCGRAQTRLFGWPDWTTRARRRPARFADPPNSSSAVAAETTKCRARRGHGTISCFGGAAHPAAGGGSENIGIFTIRPPGIVDKESAALFLRKPISGPQHHQRLSQTGISRFQYKCHAPLADRLSRRPIPAGFARSLAIPWTTAGPAFPFLPFAELGR